MKWKMGNEKWKMTNIRLLKLTKKASPLNRPLFCSVDLRKLRRVAKQVSLNIVEEKILSVGVREVQAVVIDDLRLFLQPPTPAGLANLGGDSLS